MQLFNIKEKSLVEVGKDSFKTEKEIQQLVEANLETLFGLEFVSSEFTVGNFRIDTLAYDVEAKAFVIVEYKKGSSYSVIDQGYSYLSTMMNKQADFIIEYQERKNKPLKKGDVQWASSRILFVSPSFNAYQKSSIDFRNVPFELWEIRKFENDVVVLEKWESTSQASIDTFSNPTDASVIAEVSTAIKVLSESDHVAMLDDVRKALWADLRQRLENYADTSFAVVRQYVSLKRDNTNVVYILFRKKELRLHILRGNMKVSGEKSRGFFTLDDPKKIAKEHSWSWKSGDTGHEYRISLDSPEQLDYAMFLVDQKYKSLD